MKNFYRTITLALAALFGQASTLADIPTTYYQSVNGRADADLKTALSVLIYNHQTVSSYSDLPNYFKRTDAYMKNGVQYWWDMYSNIPVNTSIGFGTYMNREHAFPKSWWGGLTSTPAYVDLFHLYPSEKEANMAKSNYPLGTVLTPKFDNGMVKVGYAVTGQGGGAAQVFEPNDEYKGDFARTYFYMVTCYQNLTWTPKYMYMLQQDDYPTLKPWAIDLLLKWNDEDPVSQKEIDRNETVYTIQNNRNPFIDYPQLAEYIWGNKIGQKFYAGESSPAGEPELITPVQDSALDFSQIAIGGSETSRLSFIGNNLTGSLSLAITGKDKSMFSIDTRSIKASLVNAAGGYSLPITYRPTSIGRHEAKLIVSDGGMVGSRGIYLIGECLEVPTLNAVVATDATDITENSYTANWETPSDIIDYYIVTRTRYIAGSASSEDILAEENYLVMEDFNDSDSESYNVRSVRLGYESPRSNEIFVEHAGITGVKVDTPISWAYWPGGLRIVCGGTHTNLTVYDITGRVVRVIPTVENNDIIQLPLGVYFILTDECRTPLRILVN